MHEKVDIGIIAFAVIMLIVFLVAGKADND